MRRAPHESRSRAASPERHKLPTCRAWHTPSSSESPLQQSVARTHAHKQACIHTHTGMQAACALSTPGPSRLLRTLACCRSTLACWVAELAAYSCLQRYQTERGGSMAGQAQRCVLSRAALSNRARRRQHASRSSAAQEAAICHRTSSLSNAPGFTSAAVSRHRFTGAANSSAMSRHRVGALTRAGRKRQRSRRAGQRGSTSGGDRLHFWG